MSKMELENSNQTVFFASNPKDMVEKLEKIEITSDVKEEYNNRFLKVKWLAYNIFHIF